MRDEKVKEVLNAAEWSYFNFSIDVLVERLDELFVIHERIVREVPKLEKAAVEELGDTRESVQSFHGHSRRFVESYILKEKAAKEENLESTRSRFGEFVTNLLPTMGQATVERLQSLLVKLD
jgi:hypothetical protein